ncbi:MAG TPA: VCBS repeat-containing protein [Candidatus Acidoferrales bacterium]|nr:VCBS repeat-containing protein [Candidatus Acidoferrales bacterium]
MQCRARDAESTTPVSAVSESSLPGADSNAPTLPVFGCGSAATIWWGDIHDSSNGIPVGLAVADFTGDSHPDLATIKLDHFDSAIAQYLIEIQLTEGGHQFLRLTAPQRDLFITPRDVTGDGTLDLVVRAVGSQAPVAVFLNDGCGHFSARQPTPFARAIRDVPTKSEFGSIRLFLAAPALAQGSYTFACQDDSLRPLQLQRGSLYAGVELALRRFDSSFGSNRAPPTSL